MKLARFSYSEFEEDERRWIIRPFQLNDVNLFVGPNGTGKTRLLNCVKALGDLISRPPSPLFISGSWDIQFADGENRFRLEIKIHEKEVREELLQLNGKTVLERSSDGRGKLWSEQINGPLDFAIDKTNLALVVKRDSVQHAYLDSLRDWGLNVRHYLFGSEFGHKSMSLVPIKREATDSRPALTFEATEPNNVVGQYFKAFEQFGARFDRALKRDMRTLGYNLTGVHAGPASAAFENLPLISNDTMPMLLFVTETGVRRRIWQHELSAGMFRVLALLIHLNYALMAKHTGALLIDDVGEGLDYERSSRLVELLVERVKNTNIQLLMSSNDRFVMNHVDLQYWQILRRSGSTVSIKNRFTSGDMFKKFEYTGLSNFDFFANNAPIQ
jgi:energy-coupling factor transporter ATP-binding protein EcfA2